MNGIRNTAIAYLYLVKIYLLTRYKKKRIFGWRAGAVWSFASQLNPGIKLMQFTFINSQVRTAYTMWRELNENDIREESAPSIGLLC